MNKGAGSVVSLPSMVRGVVLVLAVLLLSSCTETGSSDRPSTAPSRTPSSLPSPTATLPNPTRTPEREETPSTSEPTRSPERGQDTSPTETAPEPEPTKSSAPVAAPSPTQTAPRPNPTRSPVLAESTTPTETTQGPEPTQSSERTEAPSPTETASTAAPSTTTSPSVQPTSTETNGAPTWLWWLLLALVLVLAVGIPLLVRASHRREWRDDLASAEQEVAWFARGLIPELRRLSSLAEVAGGWNIAESRVAAVEDRLTALEPSAPDEAAQLRAITLRDAVRAARGQMHDLVESGRPETLAQDLDTVAARLEQVLGAANPLD